MRVTRSSLVALILNELKVEIEDRKAAFQAASGAVGAAWAVHARPLIERLDWDLQELRRAPSETLAALAARVEAIRDRLPAKIAPEEFEPPTWAGERKALVEQLKRSSSPQALDIRDRLRGLAHPAIQRLRVGVEQGLSVTAEKFPKARSGPERIDLARVLDLLNEVLEEVAGLEASPPADPVSAAGELLAHLERALRGPTAAPTPSTAAAADGGAR